MNPVEVCIRRPVFATVLSLVLVLLGIVSYSRLTVREYPNVDEPTVCTPADAVRTFLGTDIHVLVMGHHVVMKDKPAHATRSGEGRAGTMDVERLGAGD